MCQWATGPEKLAFFYIYSISHWKRNGLSSARPPANASVLTVFSISIVRLVVVRSILLRFRMDVDAWTAAVTLLLMTTTR